MIFQSVDLSHRTVIEKYMNEYGENSCQHSFVTMYLLSEKYGDCICEKDGWLFTLRENRCDEQYRTYLIPMGSGKLEEAMELLTEDARTYGKAIRFETLTQIQKERVNSLYPNRFIIEDHRDMYEYIYAQNRIASMAGSSLRKRRQQIRAFGEVVGSDAKIQVITPQDIVEICEFQKEWLLSKVGESDFEYLQQEHENILKALGNYDDLGLVGIVLRISGKVRGFACGNYLSENCVDMIMQKADRNIPGVYTVLHQEFAQRFGKESGYINWEEDVGKEGLRQAKLSYKPDILLEKYILSEEIRNE